MTGRRGYIDDLTAAHGIETVEVGSAESIDQATRDALDAGCSRLIVIGGDGTLQGTVTSLAASADPDALPELMILGGGRTNYTARDLGTASGLRQQLKRALEQPGTLNVTTRHTLRLSQDPGQDLHGFFIAGALVDHAIRDCHAYRAEGSGPLRTGHLSSAWRISQLGMKSLLGRSGFHPPQLQVSASGLGQIDAPTRMFLATSLHHRGEWLSPYANRGQGPLRLSVFSHKAKRFWSSLPALMRGRFDDRRHTPENGYLSGRCAAFRVRGLARVCLDGQEHDFDPRRELEISTGPAFRFAAP